MEEINKEDLRKSFNAKFNLGLVLRTTLKDLKKIENFFDSLESTDTVYCKTSASKLYIVEEKTNDIDFPKEGKNDIK